MVYDMMDCIFNDIGDIKASHNTADQNIDVTFGVDDVKIPLHDGAAKWWQDHGYDYAAELKLLLSAPILLILSALFVFCRDVPVMAERIPGHQEPGVGRHLCECRWRPEMN